MNLESVYSLNPGSTLSSLVWSTSVLPIQVLGRKATRTAHKYRALLRMLHLETGSVELAKIRTCSFLSAVHQSCRFCADIDTDPSRRTFSQHASETHDLDHAFHHVMEELRECWF